MELHLQRIPSHLFEMVSEVNHRCWNFPFPISRIVSVENGCMTVDSMQADVLWVLVVVQYAEAVSCFDELLHVHD